MAGRQASRDPELGDPLVTQLFCAVLRAPLFANANGALPMASRASPVSHAATLAGIFRYFPSSPRPPSLPRFVSASRTQKCLFDRHPVPLLSLPLPLVSARRR